jgi:uncharacterized membrane protein
VAEAPAAPGRADAVPLEGTLSRSLAASPITDAVSPEEAARIAELAPEALALASLAYNSGVRGMFPSCTALLSWHLRPLRW